MIKTATDLYETRSDIIDTFEGKEQTKEGEQIEEPNFDWLHRPKKELEELIKDINSDIDLDNDERLRL